MHADRMDAAFALLDAGKFDEARIAFEEAYRAEDPDAPLALLGLAELFETVGDDESRLAVANKALEHENNTLRLTMMRFHHVPMLWSKSHDPMDAEKVIKSRADMVVRTASYLPLQQIEQDAALKAAIFVSEQASSIFYMFEARIAEAQFHAAMLLACYGDREVQIKAMHNLHFFLRSTSPGEIGAMRVVNNMTHSSWPLFDETLERLAICYKQIESMAELVMDELTLRRLDAEFDSAMSASNPQSEDVYNGLARLGVIVNHLVSGNASEDDFFTKTLLHKYRNAN
jgi:tetratricopeptide (TPR) repeat protein